MSRIFRRPMFRGGSTNMNGIMSGIEDRKKYAEGSARERLAKVAAEYPSQAIDPLSQFLIQGGLNLVSQPSTGGVFSDIASAAKEPTGQLFKGLAQQGQLGKKLALEGEMIDIEGERQERIAKLKAQKESGFQKDYSPDRKQFELYKQYTDPKLSQFTTKIQQDFPQNMSDYGSYIKQAAEKKGVRIIDVVPYEKKGKKYSWDFDQMIPGGLYFKPDVGFVYERDPENNVLIEYDPRTFEEIRKLPLER